MLKNLQEWVILFVIVSIMVLIGNWAGYDVMPLDALPGIIVLALISLIGLIIHRINPYKGIPSIAYIGILAFIITIPGVPGSEQIVEWTSKVNLLAIATPILAYAGISIGRSWTDFAKLGWKTIIVGMFVLLGTFLGSAIIAEIILRMQGII
ncbi:hypothetical protein CD30_17890 [Ureibacillus massiliensis 4400831 = CIP 108448 = CCUG 49529]|uniref:DUF340 domain-containing protein n=1 Tax=Ureibacillus massiliensis 4400831 = CIP 108448 = CCUG 49529 TaxID=1211035 RepID=A0A0A3JPG4_9BACL|nr:hypothetical protein [Ureibacillus massiliensis]KGR88912.1 hypothetical protein CD30_17890 [Ureibacillus massiliensis 4400831 = CIP 108448 = CCUG 49529]